SLIIASTPTDADIEIDGSLVGDTPSTVNVAPGSHEITVEKTGFTNWTRKLDVTGGSVHLDATLATAPAH
ncbi:MAG: PEGA domain-containing protein, partial [Terracidiphilus sp.]